jgi:ABC-type sulfate transport system permease component
MGTILSKSAALLLVPIILTAPCIIVVKPVCAPSVIDNTWTTRVAAASVAAVAVVSGGLLAYFKRRKH